MTTATRLTLCLTLLAVACVTAACVTVETDPEPRWVVTRTQDQVTWISSVAQGLPIESVRVADLRFSTGSGRLAQLTTDERIRDAASGFGQAMSKALLPKYELGGEAGPRQLVMEMLVTDRVEDPLLYDHLDGLGGRSDGLLPGLAIQARFLHGETGETLASLVSLRESPQLVYALGPEGGEEAAAKAFLPLALRVRSALDRAWDWNHAMKDAP
jgi:hypothetical protein